MAAPASWPVRIVDYISSKKEDGNNDQIRRESIYLPPEGYEFVLGTRKVTVLYTEGSRGFDNDWDGPDVIEDTPTHIKVSATTRHHVIGTSGYIKYQIDARVIRAVQVQRPLPLAGIAGLFGMMGRQRMALVPQ